MKIACLKPKGKIKKPDMPNDEMNIDLRQEEEEEEVEQQQDGNQPKEGNNQQSPQTPCKTPKCWVQKNHPP